MTRGHEGWAPIPDGARVRLSSHQWPGVFTKGSATVLRHFWNGRWLEYVVLLDEGIRYIGSETAEWSADHVIEIKDPEA